MAKKRKKAGASKAAKKTPGQKATGKKAPAKKATAKKATAKKATAKKAATKRSSNHRGADTGGDSGARLLLVAGALLAAAAGVWVFMADAPPGATSPNGAAAQGPGPSTPTLPTLGTTVPEALRVEVLATHAHDREAFTQGLLWHDGRLYESTGLEGHSTLRSVDLVTGEVQRRHELSDELFAEGLARVGENLLQLTWQSGRAFVYRSGDFSVVREHEYEGEGWGLCHDGERLVMSDGSSDLTFRDPETFEDLGRVAVTKLGRPLRNLNELECVDGQVYANVWMTDEIVRIDPASGRVTATIDASDVYPTAQRRRDRADVLNGIAWMPESARFVITGKRWPHLYEVRFVPR